MALKSTRVGDTCSRDVRSSSVLTLDWRVVLVLFEEPTSKIMANGCKQSSWFQLLLLFWQRHHWLNIGCYHVKSMKYFSDQFWFKCVLCSLLVVWGHALLSSVVMESSNFPGSPGQPGTGEEPRKGWRLILSWAWQHGEHGEQLFRRPDGSTLRSWQGVVSSPVETVTVSLMAMHQSKRSLVSHAS
jgi:hypothetical protein